VRLDVLDLGFGIVPPFVVDAHRGGHPTPITSDKAELRPGVAASLPLGAARLARKRFRTDPSWRRDTDARRKHVGVPREGVSLRRLDALDGTAQIDRSAQDASERLGRLTTFEARCTG
jgi:hypothetical protein